VAQPADAEGLSPYLPQVSCDPTVSAGVDRLRDLALATYQRGHDGGVTRTCAAGGSSEHKEGRAWDWLLDVRNARDRATAGDFLAWLVRPGPDGTPGLQARRLGIMYVIYNRRIWSTYRAREGWRVYSGSASHSDHIHLSFGWAGARGRTSFWTGQVAAVDYGRCAAFADQPAILTITARATPCPGSAPLVKRSSWAKQVVGSGGTALRTAQSRLGVAETGRFDQATWEAVRDFQARTELPRSGALDQPTWASLVPRSVTWNVATGYDPAAAADHAAAHYSDVVLRRGAAGAPVIFLQTALSLPPRQRTGFYGPHTRVAVREFKVAHGLADNGAVNRRVWRILAAAS
jgi:peptidoglycan hydrolase-like protein with peptidoglycan-binding domain